MDEWFVLLPYSEEITVLIAVQALMCILTWSKNMHNKVDLKPNIHHKH